MNLSKHLEFFNPVELTKPIHIIGLGAIGSHIAMQLVRLGCNNFYLYDFDTVEDKNVANQIYYYKDRNKLKTDATLENLYMINPDLKIKTFDKGYTTQALSGYVFMCVDSIELRHSIATSQLYNNNIDSMYDFRMGLADAQHYATTWSNESMKDNFIKTMTFSSEEAKAGQPVSACGTTLSVLPTIQTITALGVANFINHVKGIPLKPMILINAFTFDII